MKKFIALLSLFLLASLNSANIKLTDSDYTGYSLTSNSSSGFEIELNLGKLDFSNVMTEKGEFIQLQFERSKFSNIVGAPKLPIFRELIEFPASSKPEIQVVSYNEKEISLIDYGIHNQIIPVQPSYSKSTPADQIKFVIDEDIYRINDYSRTGIAEITKSGSLRGVDIGVLEIRPFDYNPVSKTLKVITDIKIKVVFSNIKSNYDQAKAEHYSPYFEGQFSSMINHIPSASKPDLTQYPVTYLIIANEVLSGNTKLQEFIDWKTQKGFNVITQFFSSSATTSSVDTWIENQYSSLSPKPSFLLIIGDQAGTYIVPTEQNPVLGSAGGVTVSDLMYSVIGETSSTNKIPSIYVGRFSINNLTELDAQVDKTIWYEKNQFDETENPGQDFTYLSRVLGVAGVDASNAAVYGNPQIRYGMAYYFNSSYRIPLDGSGVNITGLPYYYPASAGSAVDAEVVSQVSTGVAFYNYTAHGANNSFSDPTFTISNVDNLANAGEYPLIVGNCCLTGSFRDTECFGESWLNAPNKGAIGFIGASMSTYWDEDLAMGIGEVVIGDTTPTYTPNSFGMYDGSMTMRFPTQGAIRFSGLMAVEEFGSYYSSSYWSSYHLFGDPSVMIYFGIPGENTVTHDPVITPGVTYFTVQAKKGSYVGITDDNGVLHGAGVADDFGYAAVTIDPFVTGNAHITVTSQFKKPYFESIPVEALTGPYIILNDYSVSNEDYGSEGTIDIELKNIGSLTSQGITVTASSLNEFISFSDYQESFTNIAAEDSLLKNAVFSYSILPEVPDKEEILINILITDDYIKSTYSASLRIVASAPKLVVQEILPFSVTDPSDIVPITFNLSNIGSADVSNLKARLVELSGLNVTISDPVEIREILPGGNVNVDFKFTWDSDSFLSLLSVAKFNLIVSNESGFSISDSIDVILGMTDGFETGNFTRNDWIQEGNANWIIDGDIFREGFYSARSGIITDDQYSRMSLTNNFTENSAVSFYLKVSSESGYDFLRFSIDDVVMGSWSGNISWRKVDYDIPVGTHTVHWQYAKDESITSGTDCGWVDNIMISGIVSEEKNDRQNLDSEVKLFGNYPNPFNPVTDIRFYIAKENEVKLFVYNLSGQLVKELINGKLNAGTHLAKFNASDLNSGLYFYVLKVGKEKLSNKMLLVK